MHAKPCRSKQNHRIHACCRFRWDARQWHSRPMDGGIRSHSTCLANSSMRAACRHLQHAPLHVSPNVLGQTAPLTRWVLLQAYPPHAERVLRWLLHVAADSFGSCRPCMIDSSQPTVSKLCWSGRGLLRLNDNFSCCAGLQEQLLC
jgi:hypothetical protein